MAPQASDPGALAASCSSADRASSSPACASAAPRPSTSPTPRTKSTERTNLRAFLTQSGGKLLLVVHPHPALEIAAFKLGHGHDAPLARLRARPGWSSALPIWPRRSNQLAPRAPASIGPVEDPRHGSRPQRSERCCGERYSLPQSGSLIRDRPDSTACRDVRLRLVPSAPRTPSFSSASPGHRRTGLGGPPPDANALHRPRLRPSDRADLAAAPGPPHRGRTPGPRRRHRDPVRPLRPPGASASPNIDHTSQQVAQPDRALGPQ